MSFNPFSVSNLCLVLLSAGLIVYLIFLWKQLQRNASQEVLVKFKKPVLRFAALYAVYMAIICLLAANHFFGVVTMPPRFLLVFVPLVLIVILLTKAKMNKSLSFLSFVPPTMLISIHVYRLLIELVFIQFASEKIIPVELSIHGRNYDLWIGVLAVPFGYLVYKQNTLSTKAGILFNVLGLLSLVNIFTIVIPSMPSPFRVYEPLYLAAYFPGVLIVFLASSAIFLHILSLRQLLAYKTNAVAAQTAAEPSATHLLLP
ncbi:MAG TPA: hypothetical protein VGN63_06595 [Flavisolibacter sp.]|jgi:hypothetical protein|nr:hypothetical protein [Flavisolibacter sp.]